MEIQSLLTLFSISIPNIILYFVGELLMHNKALFQYFGLKKIQDNGEESIVENIITKIGTFVRVLAIANIAIPFLRWIITLGS